MKVIKDEKSFNELCRMIKDLGHIYNTKKVYSDFLTACAVCISNSVCGIHFAKREAYYEEALRGYRPEHKAKFPVMFELLTKILDANARNYTDVFYELSEKIATRNKNLKQNFSPAGIGKIIAKIQQLDVEKNIKERGFSEIVDFTCGTGSLILQCANELSYAFNPRTQLCATLVDIDFACVCAAYIQLSLYGIPAVVIHGDSLNVSEYSRWYTPVYIMDGWVWKCKCAMVDTVIADDEMIKMASEPIYAAIKTMYKLEQNRIDKEEF